MKSNPRKTVVSSTNNVQSRLAEIARRDFTKRNDFDECDEDEEEETGNGEAYNIDPSTNIWKPIDFGRNSKLAVSNKYSASKESNDSSAEDSRGNVLAPLNKSSHGRSSSHSLTEKKSESKESSIKQQPELLSPPPNQLPSLNSASAGENKSPQSVSSSEIITPKYNRLTSDEYREVEHILDPSKRKPPKRLDSDSQVTATTISLLLTEKENMKVMLAAIEQEKKEILKNSAIKAEQKQKETELAAAERDELRVALEMLRSQNEILAQHMKTTQEQVKQQLEEERKQQEAMLLEMESKNKLLTQQVLEQQAEAERKLAAERDELKNALKRMENEKFELSRKIFETEFKAKADAELLMNQKQEFLSKCLEMEKEKDSLLSKMEAIENESKSASDKVKAELQQEKSSMDERIKQMEMEKQSLSELFKKSEASAQLKAEEIAKQIAAEKEDLRLSMLRMENEKLELAKALANAETMAKQQAAIVAQQLQKEKEEMAESLAQMENEKAELAKKLAENEKQSMLEAASNEEKVKEEHEKLRLYLLSMQQEKEELEKKLKEAADLATQKERENLDRVAKERDELRQAVERMKKEMELERQRVAMLESTKEEANKSKMNLKSTTSLYDIMEKSEQAKVTSPRNEETSKKHEITPIKENESAEVDDVGQAENVEDNYSDSDEEDEENQQFDDLPAPHRAAARGEFDQLKSLYDLQPNLLLSLDAACRNPLFYAAAYNHVDIALFLIHSCNNSVVHQDMHGDTPIHAAASAGSDDVMNILLENLNGENVDIRNAMGMTPSHICESSACLELLYAAGCDLTLMDGNGRSALFIASAMNRVSCVQFLIDCLDGHESAVYAQDSRGDTALHAAACNGAEDCLLLLLQCGISPLVTNHKGLKAIDLAHKNKKKKCREILAQYHLHYATNSDFDSVLFLATLEGQKKVQDTVLNAIHNRDDEEAYNIIKQNVDPNSGSDLSSAEVMNKVKALFSMNNNKSLRLKRWGSWIAYEDQNTKSTYWYNSKTGGGQWAVPDKLKSLVQGSSTPPKGMKHLVSKSSMRLKRIGDWIQYSTEGGKTFYYNDKNGEFQWANPHDSRDNEMMNQAKEQEWKPYKDPQTGAVFWYNHRTNVSQWECPLTDKNEIASSKSKNHSDRYNETVVEVHSEDDLGIG